MKNLIFLCLSVLFVSSCSASAGSEKSLSLTDSSYGCEVVTPLSQSDVVDFTNNAFVVNYTAISSSNYFTIEKTGSTTIIGTYSDALRLCGPGNKLDPNESTKYRSPFVDLKYVWENEHNFNC